MTISERAQRIVEVRQHLREFVEARFAGWAIEYLGVDGLCSVEALRDLVLRWLSRCEPVLNEKEIASYYPAARAALAGLVSAPEANAQWELLWCSPPQTSTEIRAFVAHALAFAAATERCPEAPRRYALQSLSACVSCATDAMDCDARVVRLLDEELAHFADEGAA